MRILDRRAIVAAIEIRMHHFADDRAGANYRDLDHQVVKSLRLHPRQRRHLRAALDLKNADGIRAPEHRVHVGIVGRQMREIDLDALVRADHRNRLLQRGEHPEPEQIDLDDAEIGAVVLVPLNHHPAGHRGRLERHDFIERLRGDHHAAAMLPEMARQALNFAHEIDQHPDSRRFRIDAAAPEQRDEIVVMVAELVHLVELGETVDLLGRKAERLADFTHRAPCSIGDHVRGHRGAAFAVAAIDVLNRHLAIVAAGQVEIDVGPFAALFGKEALEQEFHLDRVHRRDSERVTHRAVGRRAASLHHDSILAAELNDVPNDQEVAGELEPLDDPELVFELAARAIVHRAAPSLARARISENAQIAVGRFVRWQRIVGEAITHVAELESASLGNRARGGDGAG